MRDLLLNGDVATFFVDDEVEACVLIIRQRGGYAFQGGQPIHHEILLYLLGVSP